MDTVLCDIFSVLLRSYLRTENRILTPNYLLVPSTRWQYVCPASLEYWTLYALSSRLLLKYLPPACFATHSLAGRNDGWCTYPRGAVSSLCIYSSAPGRCGSGLRCCSRHQSVLTLLSSGPALTSLQYLYSLRGEGQPSVEML